MDQSEVDGKLSKPFAPLKVDLFADTGLKKKVKPSRLVKSRTYKLVPDRDVKTDLLDLSVRKGPTIAPLDSFGPKDVKKLDQFRKTLVEESNREGEDVKAAAYVGKGGVPFDSDRPERPVGYPVAQVDRDGYLVPFSNPNPLPSYTILREVEGPPGYLGSLTLTGEQRTHLSSIERILQEFPGYIDTSQMGSGKTYTALAVGLKYGLAIHVTGPSNVEPVWQAVCSRHGISLTFSTYSKLARADEAGPNRLLIRTEQMVTEIGKDLQGRPTEFGFPSVRYDQTEALESLISKGVLFIFDEVQTIRNWSTNKFRAVAALTRAVTAARERNTPSHFALLSACPYDKKTQLAGLFYLLNVTGRPEVYDHTGAVIDLPKIRAYLKKLDSRTELELEQRFKTADLPVTIDFIFQGYVRIIKPRVVCGMTTTLSTTYRQELRNGFYYINSRFVSEATEAIEDLRTVLETQRPKKSGRLAGVTSALLKLELAFAYDLALRGKFLLDEDPRCKVILGFNYTEPLRRVKHLLQAYQPLELNGKVAKADRADLITTFNLSRDFRLLLMNLQVGAVGISLHDTIGGEERHMLLNPSYQMQTLYQAFGRIWRSGVASNSYGTIFYGHPVQGLDCHLLIDSLVRKSDITRLVVDRKVAETLTLPGDLPNYVEKI